MENNEQAQQQAKPWTQWIEIPVTDMERAKRFYEEILQITIATQDLGGFKMGFFPQSQVGVALCWGTHYTPSAEGTLVYLNANPDLAQVANRIEAAGGKLLRDKTLISPEHGFMALFLDTEGNRVALHSGL
jgi:uncharacterized protein